MLNGIWHILFLLSLNVFNLWFWWQHYKSYGELSKQEKEEPQPTGVRPIKDSVVLVGPDSTICIMQPIKKMYGTLNWQTGEYIPSERDEV